MCKRKSVNILIGLTFNLIIETVDKDYKNLHELTELYKKSFPRCERDSVKHLLHHPKSEGDFIAFKEDNVFCGFAYLLTYNNLTHILYFAVENKIRNKGYGSKILKMICEKFSDNKIILDVEKEEDFAKNSLERIKRVNFYLHNGFKETEIAYTWKNIDYEILSNKPVSIEEFDEFWHHFEFEEDMGEFLYNTFKRI